MTIAEEDAVGAEQQVRENGSLGIVVKEETPFLPKVAFALITLASLAGATFTASGFGLGWPAVLLRWLGLWSLALVGGFCVWRLVYLHTTERDLDQARVDALTRTALGHADRVTRFLVPLVAVGAGAALASGYLAGQPRLRWSLVAGALAVALLLLPGVGRRATAAAALAVTAALLVGWAVADAGTGWHGAVRLLHLVAFSLWLGGALWNITVAMPAGRAHPYLDAVLAGARQLDRFRWVVRFALPTIIGTGLVMANAYRVMPAHWWLAFPGVLIPLKVVFIVALVVVFIACPLFRQCSPVQGVCNIDDLDPQRHDTAA